MRAMHGNGFWACSVVVVIGCGLPRTPLEPAAADGGNEMPAADGGREPRDAAALVGPAADGDGDSADAASGASDASALFAPSAIDPAPGVAPDQPSYEVPVSSDALKPYATFPVSGVTWRVQGDQARLGYDFPAALSGKAQRVDLSGVVDAPGHATLSGSIGSAQCAFTSQAVRCDELLPGLQIDLDLARSMIEAQPTTEQNMRLSVVESFSGDPIGVLRFAPGSAADGGDDGAKGAEDQGPSHRGNGK